MKRTHLVWSAFAVCALVGFGVLAWFSGEMLRVQRASDEAARAAALEENVRLALWRMDSALAAIHGLEEARSWEDYRPFSPAAVSYNAALAPLPAGSVMLPSPLLGHTPPFVRLHFQVGADGVLRSPQVPATHERVAAIAAGATSEEIEKNADSLATFHTLIAAETFAAIQAPSPAPKESASSTLAGTDKLAAEFTVPPEVVLNFDVPPEPGFAIPPESPDAQQRKNTIEQSQRQTLVADQTSYNRNKRSRGYAETDRGSSAALIESSDTAGTSEREVAKAETPPAAAALAPAPIALAEARRQEASLTDRRDVQEPVALWNTAPPTNAIEEPMRAVWTSGELLMVRRVTTATGVLQQGVWLDWPELRAWLLSRVSDLLPGAQLEPATSGGATTALEASRRLAFLPVRLVPGRIHVDVSNSWSALPFGLSTAWIGAVVATAALAFLLGGTLRLSERRGAFVSAVTHELRTPLTTFRMYTEMLSSGMVPDEAKRRSYLDTLRKEAERLSHLVENVLGYARLERGRASSRVEDTTPGALLDRMEERLRQRLEQGRLTLKVEFADGVRDQALRTDVTAVEQIVFNLVDNATKYARRAEGGGSVTITVESGARGRLAISVADQGPGLAPSMRKRLFEPFSKSATEAANSQPGVGLGLAFSRRLARDELHGELALERTGDSGTVFRLEIPA